MAEELHTDELLGRLLASSSPESYLSTIEPEDRTLSEYLFSLLREKGLGRSAVFEAAGIDRTHGYQGLRGYAKDRPDRAVMLAFGLRCTIQETQRLLRFCWRVGTGVQGTPGCVIIYCIEHGSSGRPA